MYKIDNPYYANHIYDYNREIALEMYIDDVLVDIKNILNKIQVTFDSGMEEYTVGRLIYGKLTTTIHNDQPVTNDSIVKLILKLKVYNTELAQWEWVSVPWGSYIVTEHTRKEMVTDIVAYSSLYSKLSGVFFPDKDGYTTRTIMSEMINDLEIPFDVSTIPNITLENPPTTNEKGETVEGTNFEGKTYGEMISLVAMVCSSNVIFTRDGKSIEFKSLTESDVTLNEYKQPTTGNDVYQINKVRMVNANNEEFVGGDGGASLNNTLNLSSVFSTTNIASSIYTSLKDIRYKTWGTTFMAPLHLDPLDVIKINYKDELHNIPIMYCKYTFANNVFVCEVQSKVTSKTTKDTGFKGTVTQRLENVYTDLVTTKEVVTDRLIATNAEIKNLKADVAEIDTLLAGNITADNIQAGGITSDKLTIKDGFISDAMIGTLSASKITAGVMDATAIEILAKNVDENGNEIGGEMRIRDNTIQINDGTRTRVQIGKDKNGDYNLYVWSKDGKPLWDDKGITSNNVIRDDMISADASIDASKIEIDSLFNVINDEKNHTINSTQVNVKGQRLDVTIGTLETAQTDLGGRTTSLETSLSVEQGKIATLVSESTVIKEDVTKLQDNYSSITQDVNSIELKVGEVESTLGDKVSQDSIISSINLSKEGVAIQGDRVELTGDTIIISGGVSQRLDDYITDKSENLLLQPNFNDGSLGVWDKSVSAYVYVDETHKHSESTAVRFKYNGSSNACSLWTGSMSIDKFESGKTYSVSAWFYVENRTTLTSSAYMRVSGIPTGSTSSVNIAEREITQSNLANNQWVNLTFEFKPTQTYTSPKLTINASAGADMWMTDFALFNKGGLSQDEMVDILNGVGDGLYLINGELLINAEYIQTGTLGANMIKVQLENTPNLLPYNYITMKNAINDGRFNIEEDANGIPFADCKLPIYGGGGGSEYITVPFGYSDIKIENGKNYWFTCELYAVWGNDTKPYDKVGSSVKGGSKFSAIQLGHCLDIFLSNGNFADIADRDNYFLLGSVTDFNSFVNIAERQNYPGVYERTWTRLVGRIDAKQDYTGNLWIQLDCSGFGAGDSGWFYLRNLQLVDASVADESLKLDYIKQVEDRRIELSDGIYYTNLVGVDGLQMTEGTITGESNIDNTKFSIDYNSINLGSINGGNHNSFMGNGRSYYSYNGGSSGTLTGFDKLYGYGATQYTEDLDWQRTGIFTGIHYGFQKSNSKKYGRPDIYVYNEGDSSASDWTDWKLLGENVEPNSLVRRDINSNIRTNTCLYFDSGSAYVNLSGTTYDLGAMLTSVATVSLDDEEIEVPALVQKVMELETKNAELEERLAKLEELLKG